MRVQASIEFMLIASAVAALSLGVVTLYGRGVVLQSGALGGMLNYSQPALFYQNYSIGTYTDPQQASFSAFISGRNESLAYPLVSQGGIANLTETAHCTTYGFFGGPLDVQGQCGTYDAWDYRVGDAHCPSTKAYCVFQSDTNYSVFRVGTSRAYLYNFTLFIISKSGTMTASVSSAASESPVILGNVTVGYVRVIGMSSSDPLQSTTLIGNGTSLRLIDQQAYSQYQEWESEAYSELHYYNSSSVSPDVNASLKQYVSAFTAASKALRASGSEAPCVAETGNYVCNAAAPFSYILQANLTGVPGTYNQTIYYLGSEIEIRGT